MDCDAVHLLSEWGALMTWNTSPLERRPFQKLGEDLSMLHTALNQREKVVLGVEVTKLDVKTRTFWEEGVDYESVARVWGNGDRKIYTCIVPHTSEAQFRPSTGADWELVWELLYEDWADATSYESQVRVIGSDDFIYRQYPCTFGFTHTSSPDTEPGVGVDWEDWWIIHIGVWEDDARYMIRPQGVESNEEIYLCLKGHRSSPDTEPGVGVDWEDYWALYVRDWSSDTYYRVNGSTVKDIDKVSYVCNVSHRSGNKNLPRGGSPVWTTASEDIYLDIKQTSGYGLGEDLGPMLTKIQDGVKYLVDEEKFVHITTTLSIWTHADLIAHIDLGDFVDDPNWADENAWERLRLYLDELMWKLVYPSVSATTKEGKYLTTSTFDQEVDWDSLKVGSNIEDIPPGPTVWYLLLQRIGWGQDLYPDYAYQIAGFIADNMEWLVETSLVENASSIGRLFVSADRVELKDAIRMTVDGYTLLIAPGNGLDAEDDYHWSHTVGQDVTVSGSIYSSPPADSPFEVLVSPDYIGSVLGGFFVIVGSDISGELWDQLP